VTGPAATPAPKAPAPALRVLVVEDEPPAAELLAAGVRAWSPDACVLATLPTVRETVSWLRRNPPPDLALMDVQLADGLSLEVFREVEVGFPVVFTTAYDRYVLEALAASAIDYLLKPIQQPRLEQALDKYLRLRSHFLAPPAAADVQGLSVSLRQPPPRHRERLLVQRGLDFVSLPVGEVAYLFTSHGVVFARSRGGEQYLVDQPLGELEPALDPARFFRINRQLLAQLDAVVRFRRAGKGRLEVTLAPPTREPVVVSQERAASFREWLGGAG
jgi:DNA-binding LytR/AlgR family response regulator